MSDFIFECQYGTVPIQNNIFVIFFILGNDALFYCAVSDLVHVEFLDGKSFAHQNNVTVSLHNKRLKVSRNIWLCIFHISTVFLPIQSFLSHSLKMSRYKFIHISIKGYSNVQVVCELWLYRVSIIETHIFGCV